MDRITKEFLLDKVKEKYLIRGIEQYTNQEECYLCSEKEEKVLELCGKCIEVFCDKCSSKGSLYHKTVMCIVCAYH